MTDGTIIVVGDENAERNEQMQKWLSRDGFYVEGQSLTVPGTDKRVPVVVLRVTSPVGVLSLPFSVLQAKRIAQLFVELGNTAATLAVGAANEGNPS